MRKIIFLLAATAAAFCFSSCKDENPVASKGAISKLVAENLYKSGQDVILADLKIGYFECNSESTLNFYKQLESTGIITCEIENYQWLNKVTDKIYHDVEIIDYYYEGTNTLAHSTAKKEYSPVVVGYRTNNHYFINVSLTEEGEKMIYSPYNDVDKDMVESPFDESEFAFEDYDVLVPGLEIPALPEPPHTKQFIPNRAGSGNSVPVRTAPDAPRSFSEAIRYPLIECLDPATQEAYSTACAGANETTVSMVIGKKKIDKVRNRILTKNEEENRILTAEVILKTENVTKAGHLLGQSNQQIIYNGQKELITVTLENVRDLGEVDAKNDWRIIDCEEDCNSAITMQVCNAIALNLRRMPSNDSESIGCAQAGATVKVIDMSNSEWYKVIYNGKTGYMHSDYLD